MEKIAFFNKVLSAHDKENKIYNEKVADLILSKYMNEFDIYYEIYQELHQICKLVPYHFTFYNESDNDKEISYNSEILKFTFRIDKKEDIEKLCKKLNKDSNIIKNSYSSAKCKYTKNSKKNVLFIQISNIERNIKLDNFKEVVNNDRGITK